MNLPNRLTSARFVLAGLFVASLSSQWRFAHTAGLLVFILAGVTDYLDGSIARRRNLVTDFGKLMDPLADKILIAAAFILLVPLGAFPAWVAIAVISREFAITGLRLLAANKGVILPSERMGKHKTLWQIVTVCFFLLLLALKEWTGPNAGGAGAWWDLAWDKGGLVLIIAALGLTLYSGIGYLWRNRALITSA